MKIGRSFGTQIAIHRTEADAHALSVITIDADKDWQGKSISNFLNLTMIAEGYIELEDTPTNNLDWSGVVFKGTAGEDLDKFETVYRKNDNKYWKAKGDSVDTMPVVAMVVETTLANAIGKFLLFGWMRDNSWSLTAGKSVYQSAASAGAVTDTVPSGSGNIVQKVGYALTPTIGYFNPMYSMFEVT